MTPLQQKSLIKKSDENELGRFQEPIKFEDLWISNSTAPALLGDRGHIIIENKKVANASELKLILNALHPPEQIEFLQKTRCQKCVLVGSGGCLRNKNLGKHIDLFPVVIRVNRAPLKEFERHVGTRTDIRILYPESAPRKELMYLGEGVVVVAPFKRDHLLWAAKQSKPHLQIKMKNPTRPKVPVHPTKIAVLNPNIKEKWLWELVRWNDRKFTRPTTGTIAILLALNLCHYVTLAGFCYNFTSPENYLYYFGDRKIGRSENRGSHSMGAENRLRTKLLENRFFYDLLL